MSTATITAEVADRFHGLRRSWLWIHIATALFAAAGFWLLAWGALALADYHWELDADIRKTTLLVFSAIAVAWVISQAIVGFRKVQQRAFAGQLESEFEDFGQRIRTVLDTVEGRVNGPEAMLSALGHQTMGRWDTLTPESILPKKRLLLTVTVAAFIGLACAATWANGGEAKTALQRAIGINQPYTTMAVEPGDQRVLEGADVKVALTLTGRTDRDVMLRHRVAVDPTENPDESNEPNEWTDVELVAADAGPPRRLGSDPPKGRVKQNEAVFAMSLGRARRDIEYQFLTEVGDSEIYRIDVQPLIEAKEIVTVVTPPAYTLLKQRRFTARRVTALEGSDVVVSVTANHPLAAAELSVGPKSKQLEPAEVSATDDPKTWTFTLPGDSNAHWKFSGTGPDGTPMDPVQGRLQIRRDGAPKIRFKQPSDNYEVHTLAEVPMEISVSDDYGLTESGIVFELGDEGQFVLTDWTLDAESESSGTTTRVNLEEILPLESLQLTERDFISYFAYAIDNKADDAQRIETDVRYIDIRQLRQYYQEQDPPPAGGGNGGGGGLRANLNEIIRRERFLVNRTRRLTRSSPSMLSRQLRTIDHMVENQSDLAGLVRNLTDFLIEQGNDDVSALNQAEALMLQASDSLAAASFDLALVQQNDCLLALAEARRTLEIILTKRMSRQQQRAMARFNQRMRQKLRRERPKSDQQIADTLRRIASDQQRLAGQYAALVMANGNNNGGSGDGGSVGVTGETDETEPSDEASEEKSEEQPAIENDSEAGEGEEGDAASDGDASNDSSDDTADESMEPDVDEPTLEDRMEELFEKQVELLERFQALSADFTEDDDLSELVSARVEAATDGLDELTTSIREQADSTYSKDVSRVTADLRELASHIEAQQPGEAVERIGRIRDLTRQLAGFQQMMAVQTARPDADEATQPNDRALASEMARQVAARTETIQDVLVIPVSMGDVETSEVNDELTKFVEETEFEDRLTEVREENSEIASSDRPFVTADESKATLAKAREFADYAELLEQLYQRLLEPRMNQLRQLQRRASQLSRRNQGSSSQMPRNQNNGGGGSQMPRNTNKGGGARRQNEEREMTEAEQKAAAEELRQKLEEAGLPQIARLLDPNEVPDKEIRMMLAQGLNRPGGATSSITTGPVPTEKRLTLVSRKLRDHIQQIIMLEISADRNAPVPKEYEPLVDGYFRTLAEGPTE